MDLDSFITETLVEISKGIRGANDILMPKLEEQTEKKLPKLFSLSPGHRGDEGNGIHFDVAVTTQTTDEGEGGVKIKLAVVEADLSGKAQTTQQAVSRIQFSVDVGLWHG